MDQCFLDAFVRQRVVCERLANDGCVFRMGNWHKFQAEIKKDIMVSKDHIDTPFNVRVEARHPKRVRDVFLRSRLQLLASLVFVLLGSFRGPACPATELALPRTRLSASRIRSPRRASGIGRCRTHVVPKAPRPGSLTSGPCFAMRCSLTVLWGGANDPSWRRGCVEMRLMVCV